MDSESRGGQGKKSYSKQNHHGEIFNDLRGFAAIAANAALDAHPLTERVARSGCEWRTPDASRRITNQTNQTCALIARNREAIYP
jgi:hypothetical protein